MKKIFVILLFLLISISSISFSSAWEVEDFHEMNGTIIAKDQSGQAIDYMININGTICFLSCSEQPYEEFYVNDNVTMNGTIAYDLKAFVFKSDFDGQYDGEYPNIKLNRIVVNQKTYGQLRLTNDINNPYYYS